MTEAVIIDCCRTAVGRSHKKKGVFREVRSDELAEAVVRAVIARTGVDPAEIEDIVFGAVQHHGAQGVNVARNIALAAGLPLETAGVTINRLCGSSLQAINQASHSIKAGGENVQIVGGMEHMHHIPFETEFDVHPKIFERTSRDALNMGMTAEILAKQYNITREAQDAWALRSHQRAWAATQRGDFKDEIVPVWGLDERRNPLQVEIDQCIRPDTSLEALGMLETVYQPTGGTVTAGNSSPLNDAAAAMLMMSDDKARSLGLKPMARVVSMAAVGVDPCLMGLGPVHAAEKALQRAGLTIADMDLVELNEAFSAQVIACQHHLRIPEEKLNTRGGALAIGHPLGASGARNATTLLHHLRDKQLRFGMVTMCIGLGQGIATVFELLD